MLLVSFSAHEIILKGLIHSMFVLLELSVQTKRFQHWLLWLYRSPKLPSLCCQLQIVCYFSAGQLAGKSLQPQHCKMLHIFFNWRYKVGIVNEIQHGWYQGRIMFVQSLWRGCKDPISFKQVGFAKLLFPQHMDQVSY